MEKETILEGLKYAEKNFLHPIFIHGGCGHFLGLSK